MTLTRKIVLGIVALGLVWLGAAQVLRHLAASQTHSQVMTAEPLQCSKEKTDLYVLAHGLAGENSRMKSVIRLIQDAQPTAQVMALQFPVSWLSNSKASDLAEGMQQLIGQHFNTCRATSGQAYARVVLVGYSAGAVLLRQAFLSGLGEQSTGMVVGATRRPQPWAEKVDRIVLLAGMNRGWSLDTPPNRQLTDLSPIERVTGQALLKIANWAGVSGFLFDVERGSPFIANLRLNWVRASIKYRGRFPLVVQILGTQDELVTREDETDIAAISKGFVFVPAGDATHQTVAEVHNHGPARNALWEAVTGSKEHLLETYFHIRAETGAARTVDRLIFIRHGIRDDNMWAMELGKTICDIAPRYGHTCDLSSSTPVSGQRIKIDADSYGYFAMLPFLFKNTRQDKMRAFVDQYIEEVARTGNPNIEVDFIGHSNGTYLLASALEQYAALKVKRVIFANSVVPQNYNWKKFRASGDMTAQVSGPMRNYEGACDWVVAIFPRLFEVVTRSSDLGSAGFKGFLHLLNENSPTDEYSVLLNSGHGAGVEKDNWADMANFLFDQRQVTNTNRTGSRHGLVEFFWKLPYIGWVLAATVLSLLFYLIYWTVKRPAQRLPSAWQKPVRYALAGTVVVVLLLRA